MLQKALNDDFTPEHQISYNSINDEQKKKDDYTGYHQYHLSIRDPAIKAPSNHHSHSNSQHEITPIPDPFNIKFGI